MIRRASRNDFERIWPVFQAVIRPGDTYAFDPNLSFEMALEAWLPPSGETYLMERGAEVLGTYLLRPNQPGQGAHVANAAFMVAAAARGQGIGRALLMHSLDRAVAAGYLAMQFNQVVSTN